MNLVSVNICGIKHTITECEDIFNVDTHFGQIDYPKCEIKINKDLTEDAKKETLFHEVVHGILVHIGRSDLGQDETFVQTLGNALFQCCDLKGEKK